MKKANILVIIIFILFMVGLTGVLITKYTNNLLDYSTEFFKYYKAYYIGYGGIEISLTKVENHEFGFEDKILSDSATNTKNLNYCKSNRCYMETNVISLTSVLSDKPDVFSGECDLDKSFLFNKGEGVLLPLYYDFNDGEGTLSNKNIRNLDRNGFFDIGVNAYNVSGRKFTVGVAIQDNLDRNIRQLEGTSTDDKFKLGDIPELLTLDYSDTKKSYLIIGNNDEFASGQKFCLQTAVKLPSKYVTVQSVGRFADRFVSLKAVKQNALPDYLFYNVIN